MNMHGDGDGDVKRLLGRAFGQEPPLRLDRDEVFRRGQRRVRARRIAAAGGVAASVVAVVVSAAAISGLAGSEPDTVPVVATGPTGSGPGPTSTTVTVTPVSPVSTKTAPPGLPIVPSAQLIEPTTDAHAASLTATFAAANMIPAEFRVFDSRRLPRLGFDRTPGGYQLSAHLVDQRGAGTLLIHISHLNPDLAPTRCPPQESNSTCDLDASSDIRMLLFTRQHVSGSMTYLVEAMRPDGTRTFLESTNMSADGAPGRPRPPLSMAQLKGIATLPGLSFA